MKKLIASLLIAASLLGSSVPVMAAEGGCPPHRFIDRAYDHTTSYKKTHTFVYAQDAEGRPTEYRNCTYYQYQIHLRVRCADCGVENGEMVVQDGAAYGHTACALKDK